MNFHIITLGCSKNTADSEVLASKLANLGWHWSASASNADILLINTCGFINDAKEESLGVIMEAIGLKESLSSQCEEGEEPEEQAQLGQVQQVEQAQQGKATEPKLVVFGCLVKRYKKELKEQIPEVDLFFEFLNDNAFKELATLGKSSPTPTCFTNKRYFNPKHIGFLKIAEGCNNRCSYCAIPGIRGPFNSYDSSELIKTANLLAESGAKELSIIAQDITKYGTDTSAYGTLPQLVSELGKIPQIEWIRLHYMHPAGLTPSLIDELYGLPKVVPYFDIPMQHISTNLLKTMNRHTTKEHMINLIDHIRKNFPHGAIRSTFIVGFPGETDDDFDELIQFIERYPLDKVGAFMYSPEEDTTAYDMSPQIDEEIKVSRLDQLMTLQQILVADLNQKFLNTELEVMVDKIDGSQGLCRTKYDAWEVDNSTMVSDIHKSKKKISPGDIIKVKITEVEAYDLMAELV